MRSTEGSLQQYVNEAPVAIAMFDREMRYLAASRGWLESYHVEADDLRGRSHYDVFPEIQENWKAVHRRGLAGEVIRAEEDPFLRANGTVQWLRWEVRPWRDSGGQVAGIVIYSEDITEHKQAEESLREREERLAMAMEAAGQAPWEMDLVSGRVIATPRLYTVFGVPESVALDDWRSYVLEADWHVIESVVQQALAGDGTYSVEFRIRRSHDGSIHWVSAVGRVRPDATGRPMRLIGVAVDITRRKLAEEELRESEERLRLLGDNLPDSAVYQYMYEADGTPRFLYVSAGIERLNGVRVDEILRDARVLHRQVPPPYAEELAEAEALSARDLVDFEVEVPIVRPDGQRRWMHMRSRPRRLPDGGVVWDGVQTDITARKRAEEVIQEADRRKDEFLAILSHELRNPLAPIRYALPLLQREQLTGPAARAVAVIDRQVTHLTRLVDDLLDISRITSDKIELRRDYVTLASVVAAATEAASPAIAAARHALKPIIADEEIWLHADPARLAQVVTNLLNNSAKYTPRGGEIVLEAGREGDQAVIRVRDSGVGLPAEALSTVFEMFHQVRRVDTSQGGLGIGLALARRLVEMHGGTIEAHSEGIGRGAQFTVRLPLAEEGRVVEATMKTATPSLGRQLKVLIVDDNADLVEMLALLVERAGHQVRKALDGQSALSAAAVFQPDVVLLDLGLPVLSGLDVARELRRRPETVGARLVALTGWGQTHDREQTRAAGFDRHLTKPTDAKTLERLLSEYART